jgi:tripartite-type tricarboxylate transporter receptor subunit TctC
MPPVVQFLQAGKLKAIAVTSKRRSSTFPNIPAMVETAGFEDVDFTNWFGLLARTGTPQPILDKLAKAAVAALKDPQVRDILTTQAAEPVGNTPAEFRAFLDDQIRRFAEMVKLAGVEPE